MKLSVIEDVEFWRLEKIHEAINQRRRHTWSTLKLMGGEDLNQFGQAGITN